MTITETRPHTGLTVRQPVAKDAAAITALLDTLHRRDRCVHTFDATAGEHFPGHALAVQALMAGHGFVATEHGGLVGAVWFDPHAHGGPAIGIAFGDADDREGLLTALIAAGRDHAIAEGVTRFTLLFPAGHPGLRAGLERAGIIVESAIMYGGTAEVTLVMPHA